MGKILLQCLCFLLALIFGAIAALGGLLWLMSEPFSRGGLDDILGWIASLLLWVLLPGAIGMCFSLWASVRLGRHAGRRTSPRKSRPPRSSVEQDQRWERFWSQRSCKPYGCRLHAPYTFRVQGIFAIWTADCKMDEFEIIDENGHRYCRLHGAALTYDPGWVLGLYTEYDGRFAQEKFPNAKWGHPATAQKTGDECVGQVWYCPNCEAERQRWLMKQG